MKGSRGFKLVCLRGRPFLTFIIQDGFVPRATSLLSPPFPLILLRDQVVDRGGGGGHGEGGRRRGTQMQRVARSLEGTTAGGRRSSWHLSATECPEYFGFWRCKKPSLAA